MAANDVSSFEKVWVQRQFFNVTCVIVATNHEQFSVSEELAVKYWALHLQFGRLTRTSE